MLEESKHTGAWWHPCTCLLMLLTLLANMFWRFSSLFHSFLSSFTDWRRGMCRLLLRSHIPALYDKNKQKNKKIKRLYSPFPIFSNILYFLLKGWPKTWQRFSLFFKPPRLKSSASPKLLKHRIGQNHKLFSSFFFKSFFLLIIFCYLIFSLSLRSLSRVWKLWDIRDVSKWRMQSHRSLFPVWRAHLAFHVYLPYLLVGVEIK